MNTSIDTLIEDVYNLFVLGHVTEAKLVEEYGGRVAAILSDSLSDSLTPREPRLRLSAIGKPSRQIHYAFSDAPRELLSRETFFKFQYGHMLEELFLFLAKEAGHAVTDEQKEIDFNGVRGHCDAVIDGVLCDVKTASPYGFQKFKDGSIRENDGFNYIPQLAAYYQGGEYTNGAAFIAIHKVSGLICLCKFSHEEMMAVDVTGHVKRQRKVVDNLHRVPVRCYDDVPAGKSGNRKLAIGCAYCPFKYHCWRDANGGEGLKTFIYSNGPQFLTQVDKQPRVFDVDPPTLTTNKELFPNDE